LDFPFDHTTGTNLVLPEGVEAGEDDTILISKVGFRALASLRYEKFQEGPRGFNVQYENAKETVLDKVNALWCPRVRPIEEWKPFKDAPAVRPASNSGAWVEWMLDEPFSIITDSMYFPGNKSDSMASSLNAVFLLEDMVTYKVIPDATNIRFTL
jgi:hypothetical protein